MPKCRSCGAEIKFIRMKYGKYNPVDPIKSTLKQDGGPERLVTETGDVITGTFASLEDGANGEGYISHFATCPDTNRYRRR